MDFEDNTVRAIYGINCFHHFPNPKKFFLELNRVFISGGGCILIEPYYGFFVKRFCKNLFDAETFDTSQLEWEDPKNQVMTGANQALSYIVFKRDLKLFQKLNSHLEIVIQKPLNRVCAYLKFLKKNQFLELPKRIP